MDSLLDASVTSVQQSYGYMKGPVNLMLDVTQRCNLKCMHCYNDSNAHFNGDLSDEWMMEIANQITELKPSLVCFCGGEPTIRLPLILNMARLLTSYGIIVNMVSNGLLLNEANTHKLYESGISSIQISLDSYNREVHDRFRGKVGAYDSAIRAIQNIFRAGRQPSVTYIPTRVNYKDIGGYRCNCQVKMNKK